MFLQQNQVRSFQSFLFLKVLLFCLVFVEETYCYSQCSRLHLATGTYAGSSYGVTDGSVTGNFADEYVNVEQAYNSTSVWGVKPGCNVKACTGPYLQGTCTEIPHTTNISNLTVGIWESAECTCDKLCLCQNVRWRRSICGQVYFDAQGLACLKCNSMYAELEAGTKETFPEKWREIVTSILVRPGCSLTVYDEADLEGNSQTLSGNDLKSWNGSIHSYQCECDDGTYQPRAANVLNSPVSEVEIPLDAEELLHKLVESNFTHSGLRDAWESLGASRSPRNTYILALGSTGAGKSTTINTLLGHIDISAAGGQTSTTSDILEFRIPLPLRLLGINNSELRIVDTPGVADTRGLDSDARFLATFDDYLSNHEELSKRKPNIVLVFHTFSDNRYDGESAQFVKMIRTLDNFRDRITDEKYSNVLFVFSHFCSVDMKTQRDPSLRIMNFRDVIEKYSLFPKPITTAVIENKGHDNELLMRRDSVQLPNEEYYPRNVIERMEGIVLSGDDQIGNVAVQAAFKLDALGEKFNFTQLNYPLVNSSNHPKVPKYLEILTASAFSIGNSEVSKLLHEAYNKMSPTLKSSCSQDCLKDLQRYLTLRNIRTSGDVPKTYTGILELLKGLDYTESVAYLLEQALHIKQPTYPGSLQIGQGYSIMKNSILPSSPLQLDKMKGSNVGFLLPEPVTGTRLPADKISYGFEIASSKEDYVRQYRFPKLLYNDIIPLVNETKIFTALTEKIEPGYFIREVACKATGSCSFTVPIFYNKFKLEIDWDDNIPLDPEFVQKVNSLPDFNPFDEENVETWKDFFEDYGTHVVAGAYGGGKYIFPVTIQSNDNVNATVENVLKTMEFISDPFEAVLKYNQSTYDNTTHFNVKNVQILGANYFQLSSPDIGLEKGRNEFKKWNKALEVSPIISPVAYTEIWQIVLKFISEVAGKKVLQGYLRLLTGTLAYDKRLLEMLRENQRKRLEAIAQMGEARTWMESILEQQKQADIESRRKLEEARRNAAERRKKALERWDTQRRNLEQEQRRILQRDRDRAEEELRAMRRKYEEYIRNLRNQLG